MSNFSSGKGGVAPRPKAKKRRLKSEVESAVRKDLNPEETGKISSSLEIITAAVDSLRWSSDRVADKSSSSSSSSRERARVLPFRTPADDDDNSNRGDDDGRPTPDTRPYEKAVQSVLLDIKSFVVNSPKLRTSMGSTTKVIPTILAFVDSLHEVIVQDWQRKRELKSAKKSDKSEASSTPKSSRRKNLKSKSKSGSSRSTPKRSSSTPVSRYMLILVRALEILEQLVSSNGNCADQLVKEHPRSLDILVRIFGGVRQYTTTWEGMLVLGRVAGVLLSVVSLDDFGRKRFFDAKGGAALLLAVDLVCAVSRARTPEPILRGGEISFSSFLLFFFSSFSFFG